MTADFDIGNVVVVVDDDDVVAVMIHSYEIHNSLDDRVMSVNKKKKKFLLFDAFFHVLRNQFLFIFIVLEQSEKVGLNLTN